MGVTPFYRIRAAAAKKEKERKALEKKKLREFELPPDAPDFYAMKLDELKAYAKENDIDVKGFSKKEDISARLLLKYTEALADGGEGGRANKGSALSDGQGDAAPDLREGADAGDGGNA